MLASLWRQRNTSGDHKTDWHASLMRAGGGVPGATQCSRQEFARNQSELVPVALKPWGAWYGSGASEHARMAIESNIGGSVAVSTRRNYEGHFRKWEAHRGVNGLIPYLDTSAAKFPLEEDVALSYVALSVGPLGKEVSTMATHLSANGYFHRVKTGHNPLKEMPRVQLMMKGLRRPSGPENRKLPFSLEDIRSLKGLLNLKDVAQITLWASILVGWFFMLRMSEFLATDSQRNPVERHPIHMGDIEPLCKGPPRIGATMSKKCASIYRVPRLTG